MLFDGGSHVWEGVLPFDTAAQIPKGAKDPQPSHLVLKAGVQLMAEDISEETSGGNRLMTIG